MRRCANSAASQRVSGKFSTITRTRQTTASYYYSNMKRTLFSYGFRRLQAPVPNNTQETIMLDDDNDDEIQLVSVVTPRPTERKLPASFFWADKKGHYWAAKVKSDEKVVDLAISMLPIKL